MRRTFWLAVSLGVLFCGVAAAAGKSGKCVDPRVRMTIATWPGLASAYGIYGDGVVTNTAGETVYDDGDSRVSAAFQVCNASNDFVMNGGSARRLWWNWGDNRAQCSDPTSCMPPPGWVSTPQLAPDSFLNLNQAYSVPVGQSITTWISGNFSVGGNSYYHPRFRSPNANYYNDFPNGNLSIINIPHNTALVLVTRTSPTTWTVEAIADPSQPNGGPTDVPLATLLGADGKTTKNAGQYNLPFRITLELLP